MQKRCRGPGEDCDPVDNVPVEQPYKLDLDSVYDCGDPVDTPEAFRLHKERLRTQYSHLFRREVDFEDFCLLPIASHQRADFVQRFTRYANDGPKK